jgi:S-adenosylmethionine:tRNA ribosyltransferase-isomerase
VGTTATRVLETQYREGCYHPGAGQTTKYIYPPYVFGGVDVLQTNFHLPRSSLLALVAAFAGPELIREAYRFAIAERFRFYSYGDAMLIV